jgi:integrase
MTPQAVLLIVQKRAQQAGVESFSPHDFRRTFCSDLLDAGVDIVTVQKLAGHASPVTTAKYPRSKGGGGEATDSAEVWEFRRKNRIIFGRERALPIPI